MSKYTKAFKLEVIHHYQKGLEGQTLTSRRFGIPRSLLRKWLSQHEHHGLDKTPRRYSAAFKASVVRYRRTHGTSLITTAAMFNIPAFTTVRQWEILYSAGGIEALADKRKGRTFRMKTPLKPFLPGQRPLSELTPDELLREAEYLRAENAYLKKLEALVQQRRSLPKTGQK
jgi:transposase-like protein